MKTTLVIFGITGDLSRRKLLPALDQIIQTGDYDDLAILGVSRREVDITELVGNGVLKSHIDIMTMDVAEPADYQRLKNHQKILYSEQTLIYLAVPPGAAAQIVELLGEAGLNTPDIKLLFEKPFGFDYDSAKDFITRTNQYFSENQIYRIDHYMAKEVAGELIRLRANAENHRHHWNRSSIAAIDIIASESIGIEDRATFYEQTGALRDVIQGHLMQLLALVLMKLPGLYTPEDLPVYRQKALDQLVPVNPSGAVRGQYEGYQTEVANQGSHVETFVSLQLVSEDPRWQGVAITLSTGKALDKKRTSVTIMYKDGTKDTFEEGSITYEGRLPDAYERVILEALAGRKSIFTTSREVLRSWQLLSAVQEHWAMDDQPLKLYPRGSALETLR